MFQSVPQSPPPFPVFLSQTDKHTLLTLFHLLQKNTALSANETKIALAIQIQYCNSMPFGASWAHYGKVLVLASAAS